MTFAAAIPPTESSRPNICRTLPIVALAFFTPVHSEGRPGVDGEDRLGRATERVMAETRTAYLTDVQRTGTLALHTTRGAIPDLGTHDILEGASKSDRAEGMYSARTQLFFHAFVAFFVVGVVLMLAGTFAALALLTTLGPFILSAAFVCLWYCVRRASHEHVL